MKRPGRQSAAVKRARPVQARLPETADLFAVPALAVRPRVHSTPEVPQSIDRPRVRQLWYAVVFPELEAGHRALSILQRLSLSAQQFTPLVSIEMPNALLLEIKGSIKLFGSLAALHASIDAAWSRFSLRACSAAAPTTLAALWLARAGKRACLDDPGQLAGGLAEVPIACTFWDPKHLDTVRAMGVTRLKELLRLPRAGIARRLSPALVLDLDIAMGRQAAPRRAFVPRERFRERCDFETEIETVVYLQKALEPVIERSAQFLRERQAGIQSMRLELRHRVLPATCVRVSWASVTSERRRLADVLDAKLHRLELAAPVRSLELRSGLLQPLCADSLDAFAALRGGQGACAGGTVPQLVERLRARLGEKAVYGVASVAEHRPEAAWQRVHELRLAALRAGDVRTGDMRVGDVSAGSYLSANMRVEGHADAAYGAGGMPRPVWLLGEPVLLAGSLQRLLDRGLILEQGPERIESGWWDGKDVVRDYYIARQPRGARWWIFQERQTRSWHLHGVFA
jgi:protein ImuB